MYTYTNKKGTKYVLYWSKVTLRGGQTTKIYFLLQEDKQPSGSYRAYRASVLPKTHVIKEIGINYTPLVYKVKNGEDE